MASGFTVKEIMEGFNKLPSITREESKRKNKRFAKAIKDAESARLKDPKQDIERLKKESENLYFTKVNEEEKLLDAYKRKVVKSKTAVKEAKRIIKERAEAEKKKKAVAEKTESNVKAEA